MAIRTDTTQEQVYATDRFHASLIRRTLSLQILGVTIQDIYVLRFDIDMTEEIIPHERMIAFRMIFRKTDILIHIESDHILERYDTLLVQFNQVLVHTQWRRSGRQAQYEWFFSGWIRGFDLRCYIIGSPF